VTYSVPEVLFKTCVAMKLVDDDDDDDRHIKTDREEGNRERE